MNRYFILGILFAAVIMAGCTGQQSGESLEIKGSDTLVQLVADMAESYNEAHPDADVVVTGGGSGTGIAALINGEVNIADASRSIKAEEIDQAKAKGIDPWEFIIARDGLAVVVNPENPVTELTMDQTGAIYRGEITNWNQVGGEDVEITLYGRQSTSGTYEFFLEHVVNWEQAEKQDFSPRMLNMEGNKAIVDGMIADRSGIGYVGAGYVTAGIQVINIAKDDESDYYSPLDASNVEQGLYPITRLLYQYTSGKPDKDSITYDFLLFELSEEGQKIVENAGFYAVNLADRAHNEENISAIEG